MKVSTRTKIISNCNLVEFIPSSLGYIMYYFKMFNKIKTLLGSNIRTSYNLEAFRNFIFFNSVTINHLTCFLTVGYPTNSNNLGFLYFM